MQQFKNNYEKKKKKKMKKKPVIRIGAASGGFVR